MVELWDCNNDIICNLERIGKIFIESIKKAFTCGDECRVWRIIEDLRDKLQANPMGIMEVKRSLNINFKTSEKRIDS